MQHIVGQKVWGNNGDALSGFLNLVEYAFPEGVSVTVWPAGDDFQGTLAICQGAVGQGFGEAERILLGRECPIGYKDVVKRGDSRPLDVGADVFEKHGVVGLTEEACVDVLASGNGA